MLRPYSIVGLLRWDACVLVCVLTWVFACGDAPLVVLGDREPPRLHFDPPRLVEELAAAAKTDNPTLTADMLEIFFTSERNGGFADIFVAQRSERTAAFGPALNVAVLNAPGIETSPAVAADGLTLWLASDRPGGLGDLDIWVATRPARDEDWSMPVNLAALNSPGKDLPRTLGQRGRVMPMASDRDTPDYYQIYFAQRTGDASAFDEPLHVPELSFPSESTVDGFLSEDGLTLFYVTGPSIGPADLYVASRRSVADRFEHHTALDELNTVFDERDPFLSADGRELYFASDRAGRYAIYVATVARADIP